MHSPFLPMLWFTSLIPLQVLLSTVPVFRIDIQVYVLSMTASIPFSVAVIYSNQNRHSGICIVHGSFHSFTGAVLYIIQNWYSGICTIHDSFHPLQVLSSTLFRIDIQVNVLSMAASIPVTGTVIYSIQNQYSGICIVHDSFHPFTASIPLQVLSSTVFRIGIQVYVLSMTDFIPYRCCHLQY